MPNKKTTVLFLLLTLLFFVGCKDSRSCAYDPSTELLKCSEATYKTVQINGKTWLAENLNWPVVDSSSVSTTEHKPVSFEAGFCVFERISALLFFT